MLRFILWTCTVAGLTWLCFHFAAWTVFGQVALVWVLILCVVFGAYGLSKREKRRAADAHAAHFDKIELRAAAHRQTFVDTCGEDRAASLEREEPQIWARMATHGRARR